MSREVWKPVIGREGEYEVSSFGRVRSLDRQKVCVTRWGSACVRNLTGKILSVRAFPNGYLGVHLGRGKCELVHRLVASAFVVGGSAYLQVNHKNFDRADNRAENLEWVGCGDNHRHAYTKASRKQHAATRRVELVKDGKAAAFDSLLAAAKWLGVNVGSVSSAVRKRHKCAGYEVRV